MRNKNSDKWNKHASKVFWYFQGIEKRCIGNKWVKLYFVVVIKLIKKQISNWSVSGAEWLILSFILVFTRLLWISFHALIQPTCFIDWTNAVWSKSATSLCKATYFNAASCWPPVLSKVDTSQIIFISFRVCWFYITYWYWFGFNQLDLYFQGLKFFSWIHKEITKAWCLLSAIFEFNYL